MLTARDIMSPSMQTVATRTPIRDFVQMLATRRISGVLVLSDDGAVIGMATDADLLAKTGATVGEIMTRKVVSVPEETPVPEVAHLLGRLRIRQVPVMRGGRLVGMVSRKDIVRAVARAPQPEVVLGIEA
jgi:CBS domain-containing protein